MQDLDQIITFKLINPLKKKGEYMSKEEPSNYINLDDPEELEYIQDGDVIVIDKECITLIVDYPLKQKFYFPIRASVKEGFSRRDLVLQISNLYKWIYSWESKTTKIPVLPHPKFRYNRGVTDGYFGIWGHYLDDLGLHSIAYNKKKDVYILGIDC